LHKPGVQHVHISHPDRLVDPVSRATKLDLVHYYERVAPHILPHLKARPVALVRAPEGLQGNTVFQKHAEHLHIPQLKRLDPALDAPHPPLLVIDSPTALVGAAQMNVVELHTWNATYTAIEKPDRLVFDLDPGEGLPWARIVEAAELTKTLLDQLGLKSFLKTSGGKGLHIVVPLQWRHGWEFCRGFARGVTEHLAQTLPERFAAKAGAANRVGKVFVDYLRNGRGATSACAFSLRARPGLGVSVPLAWEELVELSGADHWNWRSVPQRLDDLAGHDPWQGYEASRQTLTRAARLLMDGTETDPAGEKKAGRKAR
jgi:bifunctional non-homologous end joining protein LigD